MRNRTDFAGASRRANAERKIVEPKRPPVLVLFDDINDEFGPQPIYGQYPVGLIGKMLPWLRCARHEILHICSGALPKGEGIRVDIRPEARPDVIADGRALPFGDASHAAAMIDPPYCKEYAASLYKVEYPLPSHLLAEAARVVRPGGRIAFVHYITPKAVAGTAFIKAFGLSTGFNMPMRAVSIYQRDQPRLSL